MIKRVNEHLEFFDDLILKGGWKIQLEEFYSFVPLEYQVIRSEPENSTFYIVETVEGDSSIERRYEFQDYLRSTLILQIKELKAHINEYLIEKGITKEKKAIYVEIQCRHIQKFIDEGKEVLQKFPVITTFLKEIGDFLNSEILPIDEQSFDFNYDSLYTSSDGLSVYQKEKINEIFSFMRDHMDEEQYILLIKYLFELISQEREPIITSKIRKIESISNTLLSFSIWVLHKEVYGTGKIRQYFIHFMQNAFENFENNELESLRKTFGRKKFYPNGYLPEIITNHIN